MIRENLTRIHSAARAMRKLRSEAFRMWGRAGILMVGAAGLAGCINVNAPDEPIVIELNINVRADVVYRLADDAANTIEENADIF